MAVPTKIISRAAYEYSHNTAVIFLSIFIPILCVYLIYIVSTFLLFLYRALYLRDQSLLERSVFLLTVHAFFSVVYVVNAFCHTITLNYPCFIDIWLSTLGYVMWVATWILYMARYYVIVRLHCNIDREARVNPVTPDNLISYTSRLQSMANQMFWEPGNPQEEEEEEKTEAEMPTGQQQPQQVRESFLDLEHSDGNSPTIINIDSRQELNHPNTNYGRKWAHRCLSNRFATYVLCATFLGIVAYLCLVTPLFPRMRPNSGRYNCFTGWAFMPLTVFTGIFNVFISPGYVFLIWRYHDAYGIRTSIAIAAAMGVIIWGIVLAWRINNHWRNRFVSANIAYLAQMVFSYTMNICVPLINSIRFARAKRRGSLDTRQIASHAMNKQLFLVSLDNAREHEKIKKFAASCFCSELVTFLYVLQAFKKTAITQLAPTNENRSNDLAETTTSSRLSNLFNKPAAAAVKKSLFGNDVIREEGGVTETPTPPLHIAKESYRQESLTTGIVDTIGYICPQVPPITANTLIPEPLHRKLNAIVQTFLLPESPLAINIGSSIIEAARSPETMTYGHLDSAANEVIDMLYNNVYLRYRQQQGRG